MLCAAASSDTRHSLGSPDSGTFELQSGSQGSNPALGIEAKKKKWKETVRIKMRIFKCLILP